MKTVFTAISFLLLFSCMSASRAADWPDCRRAKLESMQLEDALRKGRLLRGFRDRSAMRSAMRRHDKWLWRECRRHSSELRDLAAKS